MNKITLFDIESYKILNFDLRNMTNNDIIKQAVSASGLNAKFITNPVDGSVSVTDLDEASQNKYKY